MIRIWHDGAMRWMPLWLTITMLNTSVLLGAVLFRQASRHEDLQPSTAKILVILWLAVALYLIFGNVRQRCQQFELTLPIPSRTLWRRHLAAVLLAGVIVLAGSFVVLGLHSSLISRAGRQSWLEIPYASLVGPLFAGLLLAAALIGSVEPGQWKPTGRRRYWITVSAGLVGIPLLLLGLAAWPWISTTLCLTLALVIAARTERRLPDTFRIAPATATETTARNTIAVNIDGPVGRLQIYRTLFNILHTAPPWKQFTPWMVYSFIALIGFVLAGGVDRWKEMEDLRFLYLPFGSYMLFAGIGVITYNLFRIDSLPVSRRTILAVLMVPGLVIYCGGYALGWWARATAPDPEPLVTFNVRQAQVEIDLHAGDEAPPREVRTMVWVDVDPSFLGLSLSGKVPRLSTPDGESHQAWSEELFRGAPPLVYNPYNTPAETNAEFEAQMLSRAIEDVYGQRIPPDELRQRYFVVEDGKVIGLQPDTGGFPLLEDYPDLVAPSRGPETPVYMLVVLVPWLLLAALFFRSLRATHSVKFVRRVYWIGLAIPMIAMLGQVILAVFGLFSPDAGRAYLAVTIRSLGASPVLWAASWALCLAGISASYWLVLRQLERAEIPTSPINCSLVDWGTID